MSQKAHSQDLSVFGWMCLAGRVRVSPRHRRTGHLINQAGFVSNFRAACSLNKSLLIFAASS